MGNALALDGRCSSALTMCKGGALSGASREDADRPWAWITFESADQRVPPGSNSGCSAGLTWAVALGARCALGTTRGSLRVQ